MSLCSFLKLPADAHPADKSARQICWASLYLEKRAIAAMNRAMNDLDNILLSD